MYVSEPWWAHKNRIEFAIPLFRTLHTKSFWYSIQSFSVYICDSLEWQMNRFWPMRPWILEVLWPIWAESKEIGRSIILTNKGQRSNFDNMRKELNFVYRAEIYMLLWLTKVNFDHEFWLGYRERLNHIWTKIMRYDIHGILSIVIMSITIQQAVFRQELSTIGLSWS